MDISAKNMVSPFGVKFSRLPDTWMRPQKQYGDVVVFCFVSFFSVEGHGSHRCHLGGIFSFYETPE